MTDTLSGLEETIRRICPRADGLLCVLYSVRMPRTKPGRSTERGLVEDIRAVYRSGTEEETKEALKRVRKRWGTLYPRIVACGETEAYALFALLHHPWPIHQ